MSRPPGASFASCVDAVHAARTRSQIERQFAARALPRLIEAGVGEESTLQVSLQFATLEGKVTVEGDLSGSVELTCQRCMQPVAVPVDESFRVVIVGDDSATPEEYGGYEPIAVDATQLDLRWLTEEQALLALPLVPMHRPAECPVTSAVEVVERVIPEDTSPRQQPFGNLRDLLRKR